MSMFKGTVPSAALLPSQSAAQKLKPSPPELTLEGTASDLIFTRLAEPVSEKSPSDPCELQAQ